MTNIFESERRNRHLFHLESRYPKKANLLNMQHFKTTILVLSKKSMNTRSTFILTTFLELLTYGKI